jgi:hypothetical protein
LSRSGHKDIRGHLRLAYTPPREGASPSHGALLLSAMAIFFRIAWVNLVAVGGAVAAMVPLLGRRRPVGMRAAAVRRQSASVIPIAARRRVQNR